MKGICFIAPLFHKVVKGQKTQTRRIIVSRTGYFQVASKNGIVTGIWQTDANEWCGENLVPVKPKYKLGEILYLKEPYHKDSNDDIHYKIGYPENQQEMDKHNLKWKNKLFMPESAARYFIKITGVRAERLQDISEEDCMKEGIEKICFPALHYGIETNHYFNWLGETAKEAYAALIDKINGKGTWDKNPWVWVYDFELTNN